MDVISVQRRQESDLLFSRRLMNSSRVYPPLRPTLSVY